MTTSATRGRIIDVTTGEEWEGCPGCVELTWAVHECAECHSWPCPAHAEAMTAEFYRHNPPTEAQRHAAEWRQRMLTRALRGDQLRRMHSAYRYRWQARRQR